MKLYVTYTYSWISRTQFKGLVVDMGDSDINYQSVYNKLVELIDDKLIDQNFDQIISWSPIIETSREG